MTKSLPARPVGLHTARGGMPRISRIVKVCVSFTLIVTISFSLLLNKPRAAASAMPGISDAAADAAGLLHSLGLFLGVGVNADGSPDYALDREATRAEAVTMLVRLFGKEAEALSRSWTTPFSDVPDWARPYVGYAYAHGLTFGISGSAFGSSRAVTSSEFITFVLRALGYTSGLDFEWDNARVLSDALGFTGGSYSGAAEPFLRGGIAVISFAALSVRHKGMDMTLCDTLIEAGVFTAWAARAAGLDISASAAAAQRARESQQTVESRQPETPPPPPVNSATPGALEFERAVFILINIERERQGLEPLLWDTRLMGTARAHSADMNERRFFSHINPDGQGLAGRLRAAGISFGYSGENLARGQRTPESVVAAWMGSTGHRRAIMSDMATHIGIGFNNYYWTADMIG